MVAENEKDQNEWYDALHMATQLHSDAQLIQEKSAAIHNLILKKLLTEDKEITDTISPHDPLMWKSRSFHRSQQLHQGDTNGSFLRAHSVRIKVPSLISNPLSKELEALKIQPKGDDSSENDGREVETKPNIESTDNEESDGEEEIQMTFSVQPLPSSPTEENENNTLSGDNSSQDNCLPKTTFENPKDNMKNILREDLYIKRATSVYQQGAKKKNELKNTKFNGSLFIPRKFGKRESSFKKLHLDIEHFLRTIDLELDS